MRGWANGATITEAPGTLTNDVETAIARISDSSVARQARATLARVQVAMGAFDLTDLPPLRAAEHDDQSFTIEWRFPDRRLAFTIEPRPEESGWHFVSSHLSDDIHADGGLSDADLRPLLGLALRQTPKL